MGQEYFIVVMIYCQVVFLLLLHVFFIVLFCFFVDLLFCVCYYCFVVLFKGVPVSVLRY